MKNEGLKDLNRFVEQTFTIRGPKAPGFIDLLRKRREGQIRIPVRFEPRLPKL